MSDKIYISENPDFYIQSPIDDNYYKVIVQSQNEKELQNFGATAADSALITSEEKLKMLSEEAEQEYTNEQKNKLFTNLTLSQIFNGLGETVKQLLNFNLTVFNSDNYTQNHNLVYLGIIIIVLVILTRI